jgi:hypothetical protein
LAQGISQWEHRRYWDSDSDYESGYQAALLLQERLVTGTAVDPWQLWSSLSSYWKLDECSGNRTDSHGSNDLTDNNTVGGATGKIGNAARFVKANSEYLSAADDPAFRMGSAKTIALWVNPTSVNGEFATKFEDGKFDWLVDVIAGPVARFILYNNGAEAGRVTTSLALNVWSFVVAWYDGAAGTINIQVNDGTVASVSGMPSSVVDTGAAFNIGRRGLTGNEAYLDGLVDEVGIWDIVLNAIKRTLLYNSWSGTTCPC